VASDPLPLVTALCGTVRYENFSDYGYANWENHLYSPQNLENYRRLLLALKEFLDSKHIPFFFVFTPNTPNNSFAELYKPIRELFDSLGIGYIDLYPVVVEKFGDVPRSQWPQKLYANPVNGHPGPALTSVYADETYAHIQELKVAAMKSRPVSARRTGAVTALPSTCPDPRGASGAAFPGPKVISMACSRPDVVYRFAQDQGRAGVLPAGKSAVRGMDRLPREARRAMAWGDWPVMSTRMSVRP
jgi:hypothetical protein